MYVSSAENQIVVCACLIDFFRFFDFYTLL